MQLIKNKSPFNKFFTQPVEILEIIPVNIGKLLFRSMDIVEFLFHNIKEGVIALFNLFQRAFWLLFTEE